MKKIIISMAMLFALTAHATPPTINEAIVKSFKEAFPLAQSVKWYEGDSYYQVSFTNNDVLCKIEYDLKGNIFRTMRYYTEKDLCPFIAIKVKEKYNGRSIKGIVELQNNDGLVYEIVMQDADRWYIVNSDSDGNMHVKNKFKKG